eukprot:1215428-Amphidinium_carterae.1
MHTRYVHVVDSRVSQGVLGKGRSNEQRMNAIARRLGALQVASDTYIVGMWTISAWNPADSPSRARVEEDYG